MASRFQTVTSPTPALAIIDGTLCRLTRKGTRAAGHAPLATAVTEFLQSGPRIYVREHPYGLLPGIANVYCLDGDFRLLWLAAWPDFADPAAALAGEADGTLSVTTVQGATVRLDAGTGRLLRHDVPLAAAS